MTPSLIRASATLLCLLLMAWTAGNADAQPLGDYQLDSTEWNGLSQFSALAAEHNVQISEGDVLDYDALDVQKPLVILYPTQPLDVGSLQEFVADGGRVWIADDFGSSAALLSSFSEPIQRRSPEGLAGAYLNGNPNLPILRAPGRHALLDGGVDVVVGNHPAGFVSSLPAVVYYDLPLDTERVGFAYDLTIGDGKMIVVADSSILINLMLDLGDNRLFVGNAIDYLCEPSRPDPCTIDLYAGGFDSIGGYGESEGDVDPAQTLEDGLEKINEIINKFERWVPERRLMRVMTLLLMIGLVLFGLTVYPLQPPRFLSIRFRPPARLLPQSEFERNLHEFGHDDTNGNYALPMAILRDEFERRFLPALFKSNEIPDSEARYRPENVEDAAMRFADAVAPEESSEWRQRKRQIVSLMKVFSRVPAQSQIFMDVSTRWTERDLLNHYQESRRVLQALGLTE